MLAGGRFTDRPHSVSHVVAAFIRQYNDYVDDRRRADLYAYATHAVGSRGSRAAESARARRCLDWMKAQIGNAGRFDFWALEFGPLTKRKRELIAERAAVYAASSRRRHRAALALLDELLGITHPALLERELDHLGRVQRPAARELADLGPAGEAVGDDERRLAGLADRR